MLWLEISVPTPHKKTGSGRSPETQPSTQPEFPPTAGERQNEMFSAFHPRYSESQTQSSLPLAPGACKFELQDPPCKDTMSIFF